MGLDRRSDAARLLVVEDDPAMRDLMVELLTDAGYDVMAAPGGSRAVWELFRSPGLNGYDLVVTDLRMEGMDGMELLRLIRDLEGPPVLMVSAFATPEIRDEAFEAGVVEVLSKPFDSDCLLSAVRQGARSC